MSKQKKAPDVGDIVQSKLFAEGMSIKDGRTWVGTVFGDKNAPYHDQQRATFRYVIEEKIFVHATEGTAECWKLLARKLRSDDLYDPQEEGIAFYMESDWTAPFIDEDIEIVGKMKRIVTFQKLP